MESSGGQSVPTEARPEGRPKIASTVERVSRNTANQVNEAIHRQAEQNVARCTAAGPTAINGRLGELDQEWDVERTLQTNFAIVTLLGIALGELVDHRWHLFSALASGLMVQHALQGWCPPVPVFRRLGYRTVSEIDHERYGLKVRRGDFENVAAQGVGADQASISRILYAVER